MPTAAVWRDTLLAVLAVSALPLAGIGVLTRHERAVRRAAPLLVCFAIGALVGAALFQLIPEAYEGAGANRPRVPALVLLGYAAFHALEWMLHTAHGHHDPAGAAPGCAAHGATHTATHTAADTAADTAAHAPLATRARRPLVVLNLLGDALHNLLDGIIIAATFLAGPAVGLLTALAVSLHEVPRELGTFGVFVHAGVAPRRALAYNVWTALFSAAGAAATLLAGSHVVGLARGILPFAAGNFLYVAGALLGPMVRQTVRHPGVGGARALRAGLVGLGLAATGIPALLH